MAYLSTDVTIQWEWSLDIPITLANSSIQYSFITTPGDITFSLSFTPEDGQTIEVFSPQRVPANIEPITGVYKAPSSGTITFSWDNSFSWFTPKKLSYAIDVLQV
jgi:hypothetical protein